MNCLNPYVTSKGEVYGCSRCLPCLIKRRRIWQHRILLEASLQPVNAYVTLSYSDDRLPRTSSDGLSTTLPTLVPRDMQLFLKRLRQRYPLGLRFFGVGEYGDRSWRPHYHVILFGFATCQRERTIRKGYSSRPIWWECCSQCRLVGDTWGLGDVDLGRVEPHSAQYVAGYVTKKLTGKQDERLEGRYPEFARMSLRPGIGAGYLDRVEAVLRSYGNLAERLLDVPETLRHGKRQMPLGRYLRRKLRVRLGRDEKCPQEVIDALQEEVRPLYEMAAQVTAHPTMARFRKEALRNLIIDQNMGVKWKSEFDETRKKRRSL